jgi:HEAT repeat protein
MTSFLSVSLVLAVIAAGAAAALGLLLMIAAGRWARHALAGYRERADRRVRPLVLRAAAGDAIAPELIAARGARGRAVDRLAFGYLSRVRGDAHALLAELLERRGIAARVMRRSSAPVSQLRAGAAERLGLLATTEAERRLGRLVIDDESLRVRIVATRALGKAGTPSAAEILLASLSRPRRVPGGIVAAALLQLGPDAVPALRAALVSDRADPRERAMAADILGLIDDLPVWESLVRTASSPDLQLRISSVRALGRLGVPQAAGPIIRWLARAEAPELRATAARALGRIGDPASAAALGDCLDDPHYWVAHNAAAALAALGPAGQRTLTLAASGQRPGAEHAREALSREALSRAAQSGAAQSGAAQSPGALSRGALSR